MTVGACGALFAGVEEVIEADALSTISGVVAISWGAGAAAAGSPVCFIGVKIAVNATSACDDPFTGAGTDVCGAVSRNGATLVLESATAGADKGATADATDATTIVGTAAAGNGAEGTFVAAEVSAVLRDDLLGACVD